MPLQPAGSVVGRPTGLAPLGVLDVIGSSTSCRLVVVWLLSNLTWPVGTSQGCHNGWLWVSLWWVWGFRFEPSWLEWHTSVSDLLVSPLRLQSAESRGWGKGIYLSTGSWRGGSGSHRPRRGGIGWGGGGVRWGGVWGVLSRKECIYTLALHLTRCIAPSLKTWWKCLTGVGDRECEGLHGVFQNFLHAGHHWLNWPECLHIGPGPSTNPSSHSCLTRLTSQSLAAYSTTQKHKDLSVQKKEEETVVYITWELISVSMVYSCHSACLFFFTALSGISGLSFDSPLNVSFGVFFSDLSFCCVSLFLC